MFDTWVGEANAPILISFHNINFNKFVISREPIIIFSKKCLFYYYESKMYLWIFNIFFLYLDRQILFFRIFQLVTHLDLDVCTLLSLQHFWKNLRIDTRGQCTYYNIFFKGFLRLLTMTIYLVILTLLRSLLGKVSI